MVYLFTETFNFGSRVKRHLKKILGREIRGPQAVERSLITGLKDLSVLFNVNTTLEKPILTAGVLSNAQTLRWAIKEKTKGNIKYIVAGPNIAISPNDDNAIWRDPALDSIIVPSEWVKKHYIQEAPELEKKIRIWPAGVALPKALKSEKKYDFLVYNKINKDILNLSIVRHLRNKGFKVVELNYGTFKQKDYFNLLEQSKYEIYLSESESQGLGMFEAWARNVPTFVWDRGFWETATYRFEGVTASPYLSDKSGMRFKDFEDFKQKIGIFINGMYSPKQYIQENFTNEISAQRYLEIYNSVGKNN